MAERLPFEVAAKISHDDVARILRWHLDYFEEVGLASEYGEELGGEVVAPDAEPVVARGGRCRRLRGGPGARRGPRAQALQVVCVLDLQLHYLDEIGAIGPTAEG